MEKLNVRCSILVENLGDNVILMIFECKKVLIVVYYVEFVRVW